MPSVESQTPARPHLDVVIHGEAATPLAADADSLAIHTTRRLCPGRHVTIRVNRTTTRMRVLESSIYELNGLQGIVYAVRLAFEHAAAGAGHAA